MLKFGPSLFALPFFVLSASAGAAAIQAPVTVLMPAQVRADPGFADGCWVQLFDAEGFAGKTELTITGPLDVPTLKTSSGIDWKRKVASLIVGPKAKVQVFESEFFKDKTFTINARQRVARLDKEYGLPHSIDSLKLICST